MSMKERAADKRAEMPEPPGRSGEQNSPRLLTSGASNLTDTRVEDPSEEAEEMSAIVDRDHRRPIAFG